VLGCSVYIAYETKTAIIGIMIIAVILSAGRINLLPIDVILGWIFTNNKRQRIFNRASNTIVIKLKENNTVSNNVTYLKD
jgi:hypothetical protein